MGKSFFVRLIETTQRLDESTSDWETKRKILVDFIYSREL